MLGCVGWSWKLTKLGDDGSCSPALAMSVRATWTNLAPNANMKLQETMLLKFVSWYTWYLFVARCDVPIFVTFCWHYPNRMMFVATAALHRWRCQSCGRIGGCAGWRRPFLCSPAEWLCPEIVRFFAPPSAFFGAWIIHGKQKVSVATTTL